MMKTVEWKCNNWRNFWIYECWCIYIIPLHQIISPISNAVYISKMSMRWTPMKETEQIESRKFFFFFSFPPSIFLQGMTLCPIHNQFFIDFLIISPCHVCSCILKFWIRIVEYLLILSIFPYKLPSWSPSILKHTHIHTE